MNNRRMLTSSIKAIVFGGLGAYCATGLYQLITASYFGHHFLHDHIGKDEYVTCRKLNESEISPLENRQELNPSFFADNDFCFDYRVLCINEHPSQAEYTSCDWKFIWTETPDEHFEKRNACLQINLTRSFNDACNSYIKSHFSLSLENALILGMAAGLYRTRPRLSDVQILRRLFQNELVRQPAEELQVIPRIVVAPAAEAEPLLGQEENRDYGAVAPRLAR